MVLSISMKFGVKHIQFLIAEIPDSVCFSVITENILVPPGIRRKSPDSAVDNPDSTETVY